MATSKDSRPLSPEEQKRIEQNLNLVHFVISKRIHIPEGVDYDDLFQEGCLGLIHAARHFDESRGTFATYAVPSIFGYIARYLREKRWVVKPPRSLIDAGKEFGVQSLNEIVTGKDGSEAELMDFIQSEDEDTTFGSLEKFVNSWCDIVGGLPGDIVREYFYATMTGQGISQVELAKMCGCSQCHVSRILRRFGTDYKKWLGIDRKDD